MPLVSQEERRWEYYSEVEEISEPSPEDMERGKRLAEGLCKIRQSLQNIDDQYLDIAWSSLNKARIIIFPAFPVMREIVRGDGFYEYTSPHEKSESDMPLVVSSFRINGSGLVLPDRPVIYARSPVYEGYAGFQVKELYPALDISAHQVAVINRD